MPLPLDDATLHQFGLGRLQTSYQLLGPQWLDAGRGLVRFAAWAPNAHQLAIIGDFNAWAPKANPMTQCGSSGVWCCEVSPVASGQHYKILIKNERGMGSARADPFARWAEMRPGTASRVPVARQFDWTDHEWMALRAKRDWRIAPMCVYEVHAGSWKRHGDGRFYSYLELAEHLIPHVQSLGMTHIELLPIMEHPLDESWGYQTTGYFAPTSRHGTAEDLKSFINACHMAGLGVILDWTPGHFPQDDWALARFDGTALFEHEDERLGLHPEWNTAIFNYGRHEVRSFLLSSAHYWLSIFHADGLRIDAVASILYLDYGRTPGTWLPNIHGGRENLEAVTFLQQLNTMVHGNFPGVVTIAEDSTQWPMVTRPVHLGGLGFSMKWNMGWMHDSLDYLRLDPIYRRYQHDRLTFSRTYAFNENYMLPLSHDEVVHGKASLLEKMPGDRWQQMANRRLLEVYRMTWPGRKLLFMGGEIGQRREWSESRELDWPLLAYRDHQGLQALVSSLNHLCQKLKPLHELDFDSAGFEWIDCHDVDQSVLSYLRFAADGSFAVVVLNFTPVVRQGYRLGVPHAGNFHEILNSDANCFGGSNTGNGGRAIAADAPWMGRPAQLQITLPPLAGIVFIPEHTA